MEKVLKKEIYIDIYLYNDEIWCCASWTITSRYPRQDLTINHGESHLRSLRLRVVVRAMSVNASRGCKHISWCRDARTESNTEIGSEIDLTRRAWISTDAYIYADYHLRIPCPLHTWCDLEFLRESDGAT